METGDQSFAMDIFAPKKTWVLDREAKICSSCGSGFSFINRRHHCRMCGNIFDRKCANYYLSPPFFVFEREKKIRVCSGCFEKSNFLIQEKKNFRLDRQKSLQHLDPSKRAEIDTFLTLFLTDKFYEQADNILEYCLRQNDLYEEWFEVLKPLIKDSIEMVKPKVVENSRYNINDFVKIKKLTATEPTTELMRGIIIRKNVANKKMSSSLEYPTILMIKGSLEPYSVNEVSILDSDSNHSETLYVKTIADQIRKLNPMIVIVEGTVNRAVQEAILKANKALVMKLRNVQFRKIARNVGAKPVQCLNSLHHASADMLGRCSRFFVEKLVRPEPAAEVLTNKAKKDLLEPSLMYFDGCDPTRGVTITISGPDQQRLKKVKRCLKEVLVLVKNLYFERGVIYQDIVLYHMKERLWRIVNSSESPSYRTLIKQDVRNELAVGNGPLSQEDMFMNGSVSCIVNRNTIFSAGFMSHYLTEKIPLQKVIENKNLKFTRIVLIPMNINSFPDLVNKGINIQTQLLPDLKNTNCWHTDEVCQLEKDPTSMDVAFYGKDDASLGIYLINKAARVFETCMDCNRSYYYHTTIFFVKKFHIKVTLELKNQSKLKQIVKTSKKMKESPRRQTLVPQAKEGFMDFLAKVAPPPQRSYISDSFSSVSGSRPSMMASCYNQLSEEKAGAPLDVIMYLECSQCKTRLSELIKLKQEFLDYSLTRFLESLTFAAEQYQDPSMLCPESLILQDISKTSKIRPCCRNSFKNRVFMVEDLFIRFRLGFSNPLDLSQLTFTSEASVKFVQDQYKELLESKQQQLAKSVAEYMSMTISNIQEAIITLAEKTNIHLNVDNLQVIEGLLSCSEDTQIKDPFSVLLLGLFTVYKEFQNAKDEIEADLNKEFKHHLEIDVQRKVIFSRLMKLFSSLEKVRREYLRANKDQATVFQTEPSQPRGQQSIAPSMAESSGKSIAEDQISIEPDSAKYMLRSRRSTYDECMMLSQVRKIQNKLSQTEQDKERQSEESKDKEVAFLEKLSKGLCTEAQSEQGSRKFGMLPINEEEMLSILAYTMNSGNYMEEVYDPEGFNTVNSGNLEESKTEEPLKDFLERKVLQIDENASKQFQMKIPNLEIKTKYFNRLLQGLVENKKDEAQVKDKKSGQMDPVQNLTIFGESFEIGRKRARSVQQKQVMPKTSVTVHYPVHFEILRLYNGIKLEDYIDSLSTSQDWNNSGGKTGAKFIKTFDQRYVFKQLEKKEFTMLLGFVGDYFKYMFKVCQEQQPTLLSKIYGIYEIQDEKQSPLYFIAMENLFFGMEQKIKVFDLKGSELRRYSGKKSGEGHTLLDTDYKIERNGEPLPLKSQYYSYVEKAIRSDTELLANLKVVDYSMLLIVDESKSLVRMGIIDYLRMYDFEKQIEHVSKKLIKGATPTIVGPDSYKDRFQKAMKRYIMAIYSDEA